MLIASQNRPVRLPIHSSPCTFFIPWKTDLKCLRQQNIAYKVHFSHWYIWAKPFCTPKKIRNFTGRTLRCSNSPVGFSGARIGLYWEIQMLHLQDRNRDRKFRVFKLRSATRPLSQVAYILQVLEERVNKLAHSSQYMLVEKRDPEIFTIH